MNDVSLVKLFALAKSVRDLNGSSQYVLCDGVLMRTWCDKHRPSDVPIKQSGTYLFATEANLCSTQRVDFCAFEENFVQVTRMFLLAYNEQGCEKLLQSMYNVFAVG